MIGIAKINVHFAFRTRLFKFVSIPTIVSIETNYTGKVNSGLSVIGRFDTPKLTGQYEAGQLFLHRVFGCRGVILFPWLARVHDRDMYNKKDSSPLDPPPEDVINYSQFGKEVKGRAHTYYQVLIDARDRPHIRAKPEAVTFLGNQDDGRNLCAVAGLDYVAHEDIMPYTTQDKFPIRHELFNRFLVHNEEADTQFSARETLKSWHERNHPWLELSDVHKETTAGIRVTVIPFYLGSREVQKNMNIYWWRYCIRLENLTGTTVQLLERHWRIFSLSGTLETVRGIGVMGQAPILCRQVPAFQFSSHVSLQAPSGHMWGIFKMAHDDGSSFDCRIPPFALESKQDGITFPSDLN